MILVVSGTCTVYFICGLYMGAPTVYLPQLRKEPNSTVITDEMASWISSGCSYGALPWVFIHSAAVSVFGRKYTSASTFVYITVISIAFYFCNTPKHLLIFQISLGAPYSAALTVSITILAEYASPKYRGIFLGLKVATLYWGIWVSNAIGTFFHWKYIPVFGFVCSLYNLTVFLWPESPLWLASKGRFEECKISHRWLKGTGKIAEIELENLISTYSKAESLGEETNGNKLALKFFKTLIKKSFYRPLLVSFLSIAMYNLSGKIICSIYAIEIIKKISDSESTAYVAMLILDGVTVFSMYFGCLLIKLLRRRTLLFWSSSISIIFLFALSIYLYLVNISIFNENKIVSILLLVGFSISVSCGPVIMSVSLYGELVPMKHKREATVLISLFFIFLQSSLLKNAPFIFKYFKMHGMFLFFGVSMTTCWFLLYKYLPETKDKTLQEIEDYFKDVNKNSK
ncbi:facilitated trehalose transporter Tret1-like isoform X2 [Galleria mellonella]|uniref:Facilitated trehalose transporter Tret1-like isoform X2 n=1 Tax=Galleria mellonella TaxID=7137 RepID=A0ABM3MAX5_GALME|nr:facilitated trehalose transporter Tret1-like isoform X2 [Galleria mellonella]